MVNTGIAQDPRLEEQKAKDWSAEELLGKGAYEWKEKPIPKYTIRNQNGSFECVAFSGAKALGINNFSDVNEYKDLDPNYIYQKRSNASDGMWMQDLFEICRNYGSPEDPTLQCDNKTATELNKIIYTPEQRIQALKYRSRNYVFTRDWDSIAQAIDNGYAPLLFVRCGIREWTTTPTVDPTTTDFNINHSVVAICATLKDGFETIVIDDSWGSSYGANGQRFITKDFFDKRVTQGGYMIDLPNIEVGKPQYTFTRPLTYGMTGNDVVALQQILVYEKFMPVPIAFGNFLNITAGALKKWQLFHGLNDFEYEYNLKKIRFGEKSIALANKLYGV